MHEKITTTLRSHSAIFGTKIDIRPVLYLEKQGKYYNKT